MDKAVHDEKNKPGLLGGLLALAVAIGAGYYVKEHRKTGAPVLKKA